VLEARDFERALDQPNGIQFWIGAQQYRVRRVRAAGARDEHLLGHDEARRLADSTSHAGDPNVPVALLQKAAHARGKEATLVVARLRPLPPAAAPKPAAAAEPPRPPSKAPKPVKEGWIEIEVVDDDGQPVSGRAYKLKLPDGRTLEGTLGANGVISIHGIDPGSATFSFVDLDGAAWKN
jgi:hypothetical protein